MPGRVAKAPALILSMLCLVWVGPGPLATLSDQLVAETPATTIDFNRDIRPVLANNCFKCHGPDGDSRQAGLRLDTMEGALIGGASGNSAIVPGNPQTSELIRRVTSADGANRMPPPDARPALSSDELERLRRWIAEGAVYSDHWSFVPPRRPNLPPIADDDWVRQPWDSFVLSSIRSAGLEPSEEADRYTLARRVAIDLTGVPAPWAEVRSFVESERDDAYRQFVDGLLDSPRFGERWARVWLDLARYADTRGYEKDASRTIWPYRDWVIRALNDDMSFDEFTMSQIAGDLQPNPSLDQLTATAFHRNTMNNDEGGTDDEEFRVAAVIDRVNTTMQAWMGLTIGCAQCHSHKYDPISHTEYYRFYAFFNQTADADRPDEAPVMLAPTEEQTQRLAAIEEVLALRKREIERVSESLVDAQQRWETRVRNSVPVWKLLASVHATTASESELERQIDGSFLATGPVPQSDSYLLETIVPPTTTGLRLEVMSDPSLAGPGPGRTTHGNFVLNEFVISAAPADRTADPLAGQFVRVDLPGEDRILSLAEVQVFSGANNIASHGTARQSSTDYDGQPQRAIDNNTDGRYAESKSTTHTRTEDDPWWEVDLGSEVAIDHIRLFNRTDGMLFERLNGGKVSLLDKNRRVVWSGELGSAPNRSVTLNLGEARLIEVIGRSATHSQQDFSVADAADENPAARSGWAIAPVFGKPQSAVFLFEDHLPESNAIRLSIALVQTYGYEHTIGRFRLASTDAPHESLALPPHIAEALGSTNRSVQQESELRDYYRSIAPELRNIHAEIVRLSSERASIESQAPAIPILRELPPDQRRITRRFERGSFLAPAEEVLPGVPAALHPFPRGAGSDRLGLAEWLVHRDNPLTARVVVNRYWEQFFGRGIVETTEDFGIQGSLPSHPELLDYLAVEFMDQDWSLKWLCRQIVTSATYRQTSRATGALLAIDPQNRLLARGPRFRLSAETLRDASLAVSGLLSGRMYGPPVYPPQPEGVWQMVYSNESWMTSPGDDRYRRALYTFWRRTSPYPSMMMFDAVSREFCVPRRMRTNTPLQALVMMNDPVYVECAQSLARLGVNEGHDSRSIAGAMLARALGRHAREEELHVLTSLYDSRLDYYSAHPAEAVKMATDPLGPMPDGHSAAELAAWTVVANVILNLDEFLTRG